MTGSVPGRHQVAAVDLGQIGHGVDEGKRDGAHFRLDGCHAGRSKGLSDGVGGPNAGGEEAKEDVAGDVNHDGRHEYAKDRSHEHGARDEVDAAMRPTVGHDTTRDRDRKGSEIAANTVSRDPQGHDDM